MTFGDVLNRAMGSLCQKDLADLSGVDASMISRYLSDRAEPTIGKVIQMMDVLPEIHGLLLKMKVKRPSCDDRSTN